MSVTREELAAYADGELAPTDTRRIEAAIAADPALGEKVAAHRAFKARLSAHFAPILDEPVPHSITALFPKPESSGANVIDFVAAAIRQRQSRKPVLRSPWLRFGGPALAASLALGLVLIQQSGSSDGYAKGELVAALDSQLAADQSVDAKVRVLISFANTEGELCRGFATAAQSGIACRNAKGWKLERKLPGMTGQGTDYRQAGSADAELMAAIQDIATGAPLDAAGERAAMAKGWQR